MSAQFTAIFEAFEAAIQPAKYSTVQSTLL
jgi:hypothetical protein